MPILYTINYLALEDRLISLRSPAEAIKFSLLQGIQTSFAAEQPPLQFTGGLFPAGEAAGPGCSWRKVKPAVIRNGLNAICHKQAAVQQVPGDRQLSNTHRGDVKT